MAKDKKYDPEKECERLIRKIKEICEVRGISNYELAKSAELSKSTIHALMYDRTKPYVYTLYKLCNALDIAIGNLFIDEENMRNVKLMNDEEELLRVYRNLSEEKRNILNVLLDMLNQYRI